MKEIIYEVAPTYRIDLPDFKATNWEKTRHGGKDYLICECFELIEGRWEGFVSMQKIK